MASLVLNAFGWVYQLADGNYGTTMVVAAGLVGVTQDDHAQAMALVPEGATIVGDYHTHAVIGTSSIHEGFSREGDVPPESGYDTRTSANLAAKFGGDYRSYLATPRGVFAAYNPKSDVAKFGPFLPLYTPHFLGR